MDNYEGMKFIAEGSFSEVYKSYDKKNEKYVAIKKIKWKYETEFDEIMNEIFILKKVNSHPNIVSLECCIHTSKIINIIFPLYSGTLKDFFIKEELPSDLITDFVTQLLSGVSFLHSKEIIHRDLKPLNIMIDDRKNLKIGDFGSSFSYGNKYYDIFYLDEDETHQIQTLPYRAPEILLGVKKYSYSIDIWSLGCICGEIVLKDFLFYGDSEVGQLYKIFKVLGTPTEEMWSGVEKLPLYKNFFPKWKRNFNKEFPNKTKEVELIEKLLEYDPEKRISAKNALSFFKE